MQAIHTKSSILIAALTFAGGLAAQLQLPLSSGQEPTLRKSATYVTNFGVADARVYVDMGASAQRSDQCLQHGRLVTLPTGQRTWLNGGPAAYSKVADAHLTTSLSVFGHYAEAAYVGANATVIDGIGTSSPQYYVTGAQPQTRRSGYLRMRLAGLTVFSNNVTQTNNFVWALSRTFYSYTQNFTVGYVPVTATVQVGGGVILSVSAQLDDTARLGWGQVTNLPSWIPLTSGVYAFGEAWAGVGWAGASAGVEVDLRFGNFATSAAIAASNSAVSGSATLSCTPVTLFLKLYVELLLYRYERTIFQWSCPTWSRSFTLQ